jgi:hypothetical protein
MDTLILMLSLTQVNVINNEVPASLCNYFANTAPIHH